ncbi:MAG: hypothetical protein JSS09_01820, partial [Verrucomicrobia bacterium]|nr:hypothetical protein [Verrucomicrobiota bacterium]
VFFAGIITTNNNNISFSSPITLVAEGGFNTGTGTGNISLQGTVDGGYSLSFLAGTGNITLSSALGSINTVGDITITSVADLSMQAITASSITQLAGSGTSTFQGAINTTGSTGINLTGTNITREAAWTTLVGGITLDNSGTFTSTASGTITSTGPFNQSGPGSVLISGTVFVNNELLSFTGPMTLAGDVLLDSGANAGPITIASTVNGAHDLSLNSGADDITISGAIGGVSRLGALSITETVDTTFLSIQASSFTQINGTGTTTVTGTINTNGSSGIALTGNNITLNGTITTTGTGPVTITNTGIFTLSASCSTSGAFNQNGGGSSDISSSISSSSSISFLGALQVSGSVSLTTTSDLITLSNTLDGPGNITFNSGSSSIALQGTAGGTTRLGNVIFSLANNITTLGITASSITQTLGTGTTTITGNLNTNGSSGMSLTGSDFTLTGSLISTNSGPFTISHTGLLTLDAGLLTLLTGPFTETGTAGTISLSGLIHANDSNISFANPITLAGSTTFNSDGGGNILISSTIDGAYDLIYMAGTGNITLAGNIGSTIPVTSLTITTANNVSTQAISAGIIEQDAGTGTTTFNGMLTTSLPDGISLTGTAFTFLSSVTTTADGPLSLTNSGLLTLSSGATLSLGGSFTQNGLGAVSLSTTIGVLGTEILFTGPITLAGTSTLTLNSSSGSIILSDTVNGSHNLFFNANQGSVTLSGNLGGVTPLATVQVLNCLNFISQNISASIIDIEGLTGLGTFNGTLITTGASGIILSGPSFTLNGNVTTSNGGPLSITNLGPLTFASDLSIALSGTFTQTGNGTTSIGGTLTTAGQNISFEGPILLTGNLSLNSGNGNITLGKDLDGPYSITITAGTGDVTAPKAFSIEDPLQNFTVVSAHDITLNGVGSTTNLMSGALSLTASNTISLMNTTYASHSQYYLSGVDLDFINPGLVTLITDGGDITFASSVAHLNAGTDLLIETEGGNFSFNTIHGTNGENLTIVTGSGLASLGGLTNLGSINTVTVTAGSILLNDPID